MNKFEVGDLVECIVDFNAGKFGEPRIGERFIVTSIEDDSIGFKLERLSSRYKPEVKLGKYAIWFCECFKLIAKGSKTINILYK